MRFSFEANEPLQQELALQLNEKRRHDTPLRFYASRQLLLDVEDFYHREGDLQRIGKRFHDFYEPIVLKPTFASREIDDRTTRFRFAPLDQPVFDAMTSLDPIGDERRQYAKPMEQLPNRIEGQPEKGHYVFVDVATGALLRSSHRKMAERTLVQKMAANRFWLHASSLSTVRDIHYIVKAASS